LVLALIVSGRDHSLSRPRLAALAIIPLLTVFLAWTNEHHLFVWQSVTIERFRGVAVWQSTYGPWFLVHVVYFHLLTVLGLLLLMEAAWAAAPPYRHQLLAMLLATVFPWAVSVVYFL
jgi:hypothetical protein